ncbi:hypothetical protein INS49_004852 [Diaporthe citri]|uniref:uncharacterized protein n=1 Tax=Diaporthe citri TaxID=83186 RepID=UPI001C7F53AB|nr:uncharacterized protein INS49_004852 [Diaporthe citri]KAG6354247.1 hypothetical protein INS49_004852 [Diaporthe citri]
MPLPQSQSTPGYHDWESDSDCEYTTIPPPSFIERSRVDDVLDQPHQTLFSRAIRNVLHSKAAEMAFAQLADGLPLKKIAHSTRGVLFHNVVDEHETLCPGALDRAKKLRDDLDPASLDLPIALPFVELIAVAIHRIAVLLYKQGSMHKETGLPVEEDRLCSNRADGPNRHYHPPPFCLHEYADPGRYPEGVADITGYWAENWIFGGVVVFSRGGSGVECKDVWLHSFRNNTTRRVWAVSDDQLAKLLSFLESEEQDTSDCPLPLVLEKTNKRRMDSDNCIPEHNIYRDRWERKMRFATRSNWEFAQSGMCVDEEIHYPYSDDNEDLF